ncbi:MAG: ABC transporter substrate-binding protein [Mycobacteriales bacterium]
MSRPRPRWLGLAVVVLAGTAACASGQAAEPAAHPTAGHPDGTSGWPSVLAAAKGQTVNWYMYGGDSTLNAFVAGPLADRLKRYGVTVNQVKLTDTVDAVNKVLAEKQAGRGSEGAVDLIWINGENFATGKQVGLWRCAPTDQLPNSRYLDLTDPAITSDFGLAVDGCESPWQQADSALVYDSSKLRPSDVSSVSSLFAWARSHPGRFTYPAPPDFTGSMAVRTFLYDTAADPAALQQPAAVATAAGALWPRLNALAPSLWRGGSTYPASQGDLEKLYASGEVDAFLTYGPGSVADKVAKGVFPRSTREAVPSIGNIANTSFVAIPFNAAHTAAAQVLANELLDPAVQLALFKAEGTYPAISLNALDPAQRQAFAAVDLGPNVLTVAELTAHTRPELPAAQVTALETGWKRHVQQR